MANPMEMLDFEKRMGYSKNDISSFVGKVDMVAEAMEKIKSGTITESELEKIPGYKSEATIAREAEEAEKRRLRISAEREKRIREEKQEERDSWWSKAELLLSKETGEDEMEEVQNNRNRILGAYVERDANDYSVWDKWVPSDPVSLEEKREKEVLVEKMKNKQFEDNNPEFCTQFREDAEKRKVDQATKEKNAEREKEKGNRYYKSKKYDLAIQCYMKSIQIRPLKEKVLTNIAQAHLRNSAPQDAIEFATRALYVNPNHVKAYSRRAAAYYTLNNLDAAIDDIQRAVHLDGLNEDLLMEQRKYIGEKEDNVAEAALSKKLEKRSPSNNDYEGIDNFVKIINTLREENSETKKYTKEERALNIQGLCALMEFHLTEKANEQKILLRTRCGIEKLVSLLKEVSSTGTVTKDCSTYKNQEKLLPMDQRTLAGILSVLTMACVDCRRNQEVLCKPDFSSQLVHLLKPSLYGDSDTLVVAQVLDFLCVCQRYSKWSQWMSIEQQLCGNLVHWLDPNQLTGNEFCSIISRIGELLVQISQTHKGKSNLSSIKNDPQLAVLRVLAVDKKHELHRKDLRSTLCNFIFVLSTVDHFRHRCHQDAVTAPMTVNTLVVVIRNTESDTESSREWAMSSLLNWSLEPVPYAFRTLLHNAGIFTVLLKQLNQPVLVPNNLLIFSAALLSRLTVLTECQPYFQNEKSLFVFSRAIKQLHMEIKEPKNALKAIEHLIRIFACYTAVPEIMDHFSSQVLPIALDLLPQTNIQELNSKSNMHADPKTNPVLLANITKCFIPFATDFESIKSTAFFKLLEDGDTIARLVEMLKSLPDGTPRKNTAITLAKLCKVPKLKEQIRQLRGIEILLSLSKSNAI